MFLPSSECITTWLAWFSSSCGSVRWRLGMLSRGSDPGCSDCDSRRSDLLPVIRFSNILLIAEQQCHPDSALNVLSIDETAFNWYKERSALAAREMAVRLAVAGPLWLTDRFGQQSNIISTMLARSSPTGPTTAVASGSCGGAVGGWLPGLLWHDRTVNKTVNNKWKHRIYTLTF